MFLQNSTKIVLVESPIIELYTNSQCRTIISRRIEVSTSHLHPIEASPLGVQAYPERFHLNHAALLREIYLRLKPSLRESTVKFNHERQ